MYRNLEKKKNDQKISKYEKYIEFGHKLIASVQVEMQINKKKHSHESQHKIKKNSGKYWFMQHAPTSACETWTSVDLLLPTSSCRKSYGCNGGR